MIFNSIEFLLFFPIVVCVYGIVPRHYRYLWLLVSSYYFYMCWIPKYALLIALSTLITYISGILIERTARVQDLKKRIILKKACVAGSLVSNLFILFIFKYANFVFDNISYISSSFGLHYQAPKLDILLPVGISFYTFQALSYTLDVYRGNIRAEKNLLRYSLFVSFFPQLVAGPIERSENLLPQIQHIEAIRVWDYDRFRDGLVLMLWGFFQKLVIADRAAIVVNRVINGYSEYGFMSLAVASVLFAFQIYCDFGGYTNIARGSARVMGFELMDNFRQPYLAGNIKEFWRRWHISLTSWFTDYLYIPLGGNRRGELRKYINIIIVFGISGLWHGASWNYLAWGLVHAIYQIVGDIKKRLFGQVMRMKNIAVKNNVFFKIINILFTFILVDVAWVFFVCNSFSHAIAVFRQMLSNQAMCSLEELGLNTTNWIILAVALVVLMVVDVLRENGISAYGILKKCVFPIRWIVYVGLAVVVVMLGIYGKQYDTSTFIYFQF